MIYRLEPLQQRRFFNVPCAAVEGFAKTAGGDFFKVLLCALCSDEALLDTKQLAERAGVTPTEAEDALLFWTSHGILAASPAEGEETAQPAVFMQPAEIPAVVPAPAEEKPEKTVPVKMTVRYSPKDLAQRAAESAEVAALFEQVQKILGRPINNTETAGFLGIYEYFGFSVPSIMILTQFAHDMGKDRISYIETVARDWAANGITEYADIEREISRLTELGKTENRIKRLLCIEGRLTQTQQELIAAWEEWGFSDEMIALADEKCRDRKNKTDLRYINGILKRWHDEGITTPAAAAEKERGFAESKKPREEPESSFSIDEWYHQAEFYDPETIGLKEDDE